MTQNIDVQQLFDTTLQGLQQGAEELKPQANELIDQWEHALGSGHPTTDDITDELFQLKRAIEGGRAPQIAESLHSLSKLTKRAAETFDGGVGEQLRQLAASLDDMSARVAQRR